MPRLTFNHTRNLRDRGVKPIEQACNLAEESYATRFRVSRSALCSPSQPVQGRGKPEYKSSTFFPWIRVRTKTKCAYRARGGRGHPSRHPPALDVYRRCRRAGDGVSRARGEGSAWCSVVPRGAARGHSRALCASPGSPVGRLDRETASALHSSARDSFMPVPRAYEAAGGLPAQAPLVPPREILPFARDPAHQRTLGEGGRQRERWPGPMPQAGGDSDGPRSVGAGVGPIYLWRRVARAATFCIDLHSSTR